MKRERWKLVDGPAFRPKWLMRKYGLTVSGWDDIFAAQGGLCAVCRTDEPGAYGVFAVDHEKAAGFAQMKPAEKRRHVRGLLCSDCNTSIGKLGDDVAGLSRALAYLVNHRATLAQAVAAEKPALLG